MRVERHADVAENSLGVPFASMNQNERLVDVYPVGSAELRTISKQFSVRRDVIYKERSGLPWIETLDEAIELRLLFEKDGSKSKFVRDCGYKQRISLLRASYKLVIVWGDFIAYVTRKRGREYLEAGIAKTRFPQVEKVLDHKLSPGPYRTPTLIEMEKTNLL